jgi:hypothetical protein
MSLKTKIGLYRLRKNSKRREAGRGQPRHKASRINVGFSCGGMITTHFALPWSFSAASLVPEDKTLCCELLFFN